MKVWAEVSAILKIAFICAIVGFFLGFCASGTLHAEPARAPGSVAAR